MTLKAIRQSRAKTRFSVRKRGSFVFEISVLDISEMTRGISCTDCALFDSATSSPAAFSTVGD